MSRSQTENKATTVQYPYKFKNLICLCSTVGSAAHLLSKRPLLAADEGSLRRKEIWSNESASEAVRLISDRQWAGLGLIIKRQPVQHPYKFKNLICLCSTAPRVANLLSRRPLPVADEGSLRREEIWSNESKSETVRLISDRQCAGLGLKIKRQLCSTLQIQKFNNACVAQLVVQLIRNEQVAGSSPVTSSISML